MKVFFRLGIILILLAILISGCSAEKAVLEKPDLDFDDGMVDFANRTQYLTIDQNGIKATLYYEVTGRYFKGSMENMTKYDIRGIRIEFIDAEGRTIAQSIEVDVPAKDISEVISGSSSGVFDQWSARLKFTQGLPVEKIESDPVITAGERMIDGKLVNLDSDIMKKYEVFDVKPNRGVEHKGYVYAGRHQSYKLEENGMTVDLRYSVEQSGFIGTICNNNGKTKYNFGIHVVFGNGKKTGSFSISSLSQGECLDIGMGSLDWDDFEIYRPNIQYFGIDSTYDFEKKASVRDLF